MASGYRNSIDRLSPIQRILQIGLSVKSIAQRILWVWKPVGLAKHENKYVCQGVCKHYQLTTVGYI